MRNRSIIAAPRVIFNILYALGIAPPHSPLLRSRPEMLQPARDLDCARDCQASHTSSLGGTAFADAAVDFRNRFCIGLLALR